jgi:phosphate:Na+ symporter
MPILEIIFSLFGGLALFLYGIYLLSSGLQKLAGGKLEKLLKKITGNPVKGILTGATITAIIQSSSITTVILVGFLNAGLLNLRQAMGVTLGAEIGTTVTAQIIAFKIGLYALPILAMGFLLFVLGKKRKSKYAGEAILGLGFLFLGMIFMKQGINPLGSSEYFVNLLMYFGQIPILGVLAAAVFTAIIQSSSATTALVITMGMEGVIGLDAAIPLILGANIGTCATVLLASIGATRPAKRSAAFHLIFNTLGVCVFLLILPAFIAVVGKTSGELPRQIANAHTIFNFTNTLIMLPFIGFFAKFLERIIPGNEPKISNGVKYIDKRLLSTPSLALSQAKKEEIRTMKIVAEMFDDATKIFFENQKKLVYHIFKKEDVVDDIDRKMQIYLIKISERNLSKTNSKKLSDLNHTITDIERMGDHIDNLGEVAEIKIKKQFSFSANADKELFELFKEVKSIIKNTVIALETKDKCLAKKITKQEMKVDKCVEQLEKNHLKRLDNGICKPRAGVLYVDILRNLERISDHANNIAHSVLAGF